MHEFIVSAIYFSQLYAGIIIETRISDIIVVDSELDVA